MTVMEMDANYQKANQSKKISSRKDQYTQRIVYGVEETVEELQDFT